MKLADAFVEIKGDKGKFSKTIRDAKRETSGFAKSATKSLKRISIGLGLIATAAIAASIAIGVKLTRAIISAGKATIQTAVKYDRLTIGLIAITGSAAETERQLIRLRKLALAPGLGFEQAIRGSIALQAAGVEAALAERSLSAFGNALAAAGRGAEQLTSVNLQLSQIAAKTSGFGRDLLIIREAVPAIGPVLAKAFNKKPLEELSISGEELIEILVEGLEGLGQVGASVGNNIVNLGMSFDLLKAQIGNTMLSITSDTAKSLTAIIDKITEIIPHWKLYQDIASQVFTNIATIGFNATVAMFKSIMKITGALGKVVWVPLLHGFVGVLKDIDERMGKWAVDMAAKLPFISQEWADRIKKDIDTAGAEWDKFNKIITDAKIQMEVAGLAKALRIELANMVKELNTALPGIEKQLDRITARLPEKTTEAVKKTIAELEKIQPGEVDFLKLKTEDPKKEVQRQIEALKRIADFRKQIMDETTARGKVNLEKFRSFLRQQEEAVEKTVNVIRPAFENMFQELFSGNTKNLWEQFWENLKQIAIRKLAEIAANEILTGIIEGFAQAKQPPTTGESIKAGIGQGIKAGIGATIGGFIGSIIAPGVGTTIGAGIGASVGGSLAPARSPSAGRPVTIGALNVYDQDLRNFDQQRLTRQVEQGIGPALSRAAADGITS